MSYFYLIASLPALSLGQVSMPAGAFHARCEAELAPRDLQTLRELDQEPTPPADATHSFTAAWRDYETQLRNAIAKVRAARRQTDATRLLRPHGRFSPAIEDAVEQAWTMDSPLDREKALDRLRWTLLEELQGVDPFSFRVILAYALKRRIAERWSTMDAETGWKQAQQVFEQQPAGQGRRYEAETAGGHIGS